MFKPSNLRKAFFGLLSLGAIKTVGDAVSFYMIYSGGYGSYVDGGVMLLVKKILGNFSLAAFTYILYWFVKRKYGEEPEKEKKPEPENENLIPDEKLGKIVSRVGWVFTILALGGILIFYELRIK